jgi:hypothetical protein
MAEITSGGVSRLSRQIIGQSQLSWRITPKHGSLGVTSNGEIRKWQAQAIDWLRALEL